MELIINSVIVFIALLVFSILLGVFMSQYKEPDDEEDYITDEQWDEYQRFLDRQDGRIDK